MKNLATCILVIIALISVCQCITNEKAQKALDKCMASVKDYKKGWKNNQQVEAPSKDVNPICRNWGCVEEGNELKICMDESFYNTEKERMHDDPKGEFPLITFQEAVDACNIPKSILNKPNERPKYKTELEYGAFIDYQRCTCKELGANCSSSNLQFVAGLILSIIAIVLM